MANEWMSIIAALITGSATIIAVIIAWKKTKKGLYNYQQTQDLKKEEVRLIQNVMIAGTNALESELRMILPMSQEDISEEALETLIKSVLVLSSYNLILEEIKTVYIISPSTYKNYNAKIKNAGTTLAYYLFSEEKGSLNLAFKFQAEIDLLNKNLIDLIRRKTKEKISKIEQKKKTRNRA